tara:strand:- start:415 stop:663 length:249 start_codon:yes stop_codon:yes gene_type:complete
MKKGDLVERVLDKGESPYNEMAIGSFGVVLKGPYEKNVTDILRRDKPWLNIKFSQLSRVLDILSEDKVYLHCLADEYERVKR